jgi:N-acetylglutamate synthase-like GNAT family acetyltransferase
MRHKPKGHDEYELDYLDYRRAVRGWLYLLPRTSQRRSRLRVVDLCQDDVNKDSGDNTDSLKSPSPSLWCDFYSQYTQNSQRNIEMIKIITYSGQYKADFIRLNTEWIETYFSLEESDLKTFSHIDSYIIDNGGQIFLALDDNTGEVVGCCALINHPDKDSYELAKMAVSPHTQGHHIGHQLGTALIDYARKIGAKRLYLEGNTKLEASIHLYRKLGFHEISLEGSTYDRCDIIMELKL